MLTQVPLDLVRTTAYVRTVRAQIREKAALTGPKSIALASRWPDQEEFRGAYGQTSRPLVVRGATEGWSIGNLSFGGFVERFGHVEVDLRDPDYKTALANGRPARRSTIAEYAEILARAPNGASLPYLANQPLPPELAAAISLPRYFPAERYFVRMWLAPPGALTTLHSDFADNFMVVVFGRKDLILFSPDQETNVYAEETAPTWSEDRSVPLVLLAKVDPEKPDVTRFPAFRQDAAHPCRLDDGDALYIPGGWFHHVRSSEPTLTITFFASQAAPLAYGSAG